MDAEPVKVKVVYLQNGFEGSGWYVWEEEYEEEGYVHFSTSRPTVEELRSIHPSYEEVK